ncbi:MAG: hypothetical protein IPN89_02375 [Saprospiraceae bacterium]|nr:hypothetical protein [Saprospiraceae bacterium]
MYVVAYNAAMYKSTDGGNTWNTIITASPNWYDIQFAVTRTYSMVAYGSILIAGTQEGVCVSNDGGLTWSRKLYPKSLNPNIVPSIGSYSGTNVGGNFRQAYNVKRSSNGNCYASFGAGDVFKSTNNGQTWTNIFYPTNNSNKSYTLISVSNDPTTNQDVIYAIGSEDANNTLNKFFAKSIDGGSTWTPLSWPTPPPPNVVSTLQLWRNFVLQVNPNNPNIVFVGTLRLFISYNGGNTFQHFNINGPVGNGDYHEIAFNTNDTNQAIIGNDQGVLYCNNLSSPANAKGVARYNHLITYQPYNSSLSPIAGSNLMISAAQDQPGILLNSPGKSDAISLPGSEGYYTFIDEDEPNLSIYTVFGGLSRSYIHNLSNNQTVKILNVIGNGWSLAARDYNSSTNTYVVYNRIDQNIPGRIHFDMVENVTLSTLPGSNQVTTFYIDGIFAKNNTIITPNWEVVRTLKFGHDPNTLFFFIHAGQGAKGGGLLYKIKDFKSNNPVVTLMNSNQIFAYDGNIAIGRNDDEIIVLVDAATNAETIFYTQDGGLNWKGLKKPGNLSAPSGLPNGFSATDAVFNPYDYNQVVLSSWAGIWSCDDISIPNLQWGISLDYPLVRTLDIKVRKSDAKIISTAFGRGIFTSKFNGIDDFTVINPQIKCENDSLFFEFNVVNKGTNSLGSIYVEANSPSGVSLQNSSIIFSPQLGIGDTSAVVRLKIVGNLKSGENFCYVFKLQAAGANIIEGCVAAPPCGPCTSFKQTMTCVDGFYLYNLSITNNLLNPIVKIAIIPDNPNIYIGEGEPPFTQSNPFIQVVNIPPAGVSNEEYIVSGSGAAHPSFFAYTLTLYDVNGDSCVIRCEHPNLTVQSGLKAIQFPKCEPTCDLTKFTLEQKDGCCFELSLNNQLNQINIESFDLIIPNWLNVTPQLIDPTSWKIVPINAGIYNITSIPGKVILPGSNGPLVKLCNPAGNTTDLTVDLKWKLITEDGTPPSVLKECGITLKAPISCLCFKDCCKDAIAHITPSECIDSTLISSEPCTLEYDPVCGCDRKNYNNPCLAMRNGVTSYVSGACNSAQVFPAECCHDVDLNIPEGTISVCLNMNTPGITFDRVLLRNAGFKLDTNLLSGIVCIRDTVLGRPRPIVAGNYPGILKYCLSNIDSLVNVPQVVDVLFYETGPTDIPQIKCRDTITSYCQPPVGGKECAALEVTSSCVDDHTYELKITVCNNSSFTAAAINIESINPNFLFLRCDGSSITPNNFISLPLSGLAPGACLNDVCVRVVSLSPITSNTNFCFNTTLFNRGEGCISATPTCIELPVCSTVCDSLVVRAESIRTTNLDTCCYRIFFENNTNPNLLTKNILISSDYALDINNSDPTNWDLNPIGFIPGLIYELQYKGGGSIPQGNLGDLVSICSAAGKSQSVYFDWGVNQCVDSITIGCPAISQCCTDRKLFDNLIAKGIDVIVNGCTVSVSLPPFDTCHYIDNGGPIWGDGSFNTSLIIPALNAGPFVHTYTTPGVYNICLEVLESNDGGNTPCWTNQICKMVKVDNCCTGDACTLTDITLSSGGSNCCFTGTMTNNYCDNIYTGFHVQVTAPATISQIQALSGYTIYAIDPNNAYLYPATAYVPKGSAQVFTMCPENLNNNVEIQISFIIPGFTGPVDQCTKTFQRTCSPPPPPNKCLTLVKDSIDCTRKILFSSKNSTSPGFNIVGVELYMASPSNALTPKFINIPLLAPGATSDWICVDYKNVNPNDNVCYKLVGHREIVGGSTEPQYCCIDTINHCFKVPDCCTGDACAQTDITLSTSGGSNCCFTGSMTNAYCENIYTGFHVEVTAPATISQIQALSGYTLDAIDPNNAYLYPATGYVPKGSAQIFTMCPENLNGNVEIKVSFVISGFIGPVDQCTKTFTRSCTPPPPSNKCLTLVKDSIDCTNQKYCFKVKNSTSPGFNIVGVELYMSTPSNVLTPTIVTIPLLVPGATSDWICVDYKNVNPNDNVCYKLVGHREIIGGSTEPQYCCIDTINHCFKVPYCCTGVTFTRNCTPPPPSNKCLTLVKDSIDCTNQKYCFQVKNSTSPGFNISIVEFWNLAPSGVNISPNPIKIPLLVPGATSDWICVDYSGISSGQEFSYSILGHQDYTTGSGGPILCCTDTIENSIIIPDCGSTNNSCCKDSLQFQKLLSQGWQISVNGCEVSVYVPQFDSCHWFSNGNPSWGDGTPVTNVIVSAASGEIFTHKYSASGTYNICINVFESTDGVNVAPCWTGQLCTTVVDKLVTLLHVVILPKAN